MTAVSDMLRWSSGYTSAHIQNTTGRRKYQATKFWSVFYYIFVSEWMEINKNYNIISKCLCISQCIAVLYALRDFRIYFSSYFFYTSSFKSLKQQVTKGEKKSFFKMPH